MKHLWYFVNEPSPEVTPFSTMFDVAIGSTAREQASFRRVLAIISRDPNDYYFKIRSEEVMEFRFRLIEGVRDHIPTISIVELKNFLERKICNIPNTSIVKNPCLNLKKQQVSASAKL